MYAALRHKLHIKQMRPKVMQLMFHEHSKPNETSHLHSLTFGVNKDAKYLQQAPIFHYPIQQVVLPHFED